MMKRAEGSMGIVSAKIVVGVIVLSCLALGLVGLVLPIVPGILFLVVAAVLVTRHFPAFDAWLRRNGTLARHVDGAERIGRLSVRDQLRVGALLCARLALDTFAMIGRAAGWMLGLCADALQQSRSWRRWRP